jgi:hypothetical protein
MAVAWSPAELERIGTAEELHIITSRADGTLRPAVPIWVVCAGGQELRARVDAAYRAKYGRYGNPSVDRMVTDDAVASTLRLCPEKGPPAGRDG